MLWGWRRVGWGETGVRKDKRCWNLTWDIEESWHFGDHMEMAYLPHSCHILGREEPWVVATLLPMLLLALQAEMKGWAGMSKVAL